MAFIKNLVVLKRFLTLTGWAQVFRILTKKEKTLFLVFFILGLGSTFFLGTNFYFENTEIQPATAGTYTEGLVGQPRFLNPIYSPANDIDRDMVELIFSGLMKYNKNGEIIPDLAQDYPQIEEEETYYEFTLKNNIVWEDGKTLTADDIIFTIETIQNPKYKSPLRANWLGVKVESSSPNKISFKLEKPYGPFLENCTLKILPKHVWQDISFENFPLTVYNFQPIGSGPYKLKELKQDNSGFIKSLTLKINPNYFGKKPNLTEISFSFFKKNQDLINAFKKKEIQGFSLTNPNALFDFDYDPYSNLYSPGLPRYFAVFFNPDKTKIFKEKQIRQALNYATNKEEIIKSVLFERGRIVDSPILPKLYQFTSPQEIYEFNPEKAKEIFDEKGFLENEAGFREKTIKKQPAFQFKSRLKTGSRGAEVKELQKCLALFTDIYPKGEITGYFGKKTKQAVTKFQEKYATEILEPWGFKNGTGIVAKTTRQKLNEICFRPEEEILPLEFSLITVDQPILNKVAELLKKQWAAVGIKVRIKKFKLSELERDVIKKRDYQSLLFGEVLRMIPDPFPFWHSSQIKDPGLNLCKYENKKCDKLLEQARQSSNENIRKEKLEEFQEILIKDSPCIFLYAPEYLYLVSKKIKGINIEFIADPSKRFCEIENWYIKTRRTWK